MTAKYDETQKAEALRLYQELGTTEASAQTGIPKGTIATWANRAGLKTDRTPKMAAAIEASKIDAAKLRAEFSGKSIALADRLLTMIDERLDAEAADIGAKDAAVILGIVADKHRVVASMDKATQSHSDVDQWLEHITGMPVDE